MGKACRYIYRDRRECTEEAYPGSELCILHMKLPDDDDPDRVMINMLKEDKVEEKIDSDDFNFEGAKLPEVDFFTKRIKGPVNFMDTKIREDALFDKAMIKGDILFSGAVVGGELKFSNSMITGNVLLNRMVIGGSAWFEGCKIGGTLRFSGSEIKRDIRFSGAQVVGTADFKRTKSGGSLSFKKGMIGGSLHASGIQIEGGVFFDGAKINGSFRIDSSKIGNDATFERARIEGDVDLFLADIKGLINFERARFGMPKAQEKACRKAKQRYQEESDFEKVDHYYYLEMEAKRKQKHWLKKFLELPVQYVFGYGTKWQAVMLSWFIVVFGCALIYWFFGGVETNIPDIQLNWWRYIYFSVATVTTLGYGDYHPIRGFEILASFEAIFGTFMWAAFITIFARKYMR